MLTYFKNVGLKKDVLIQETIVVSFPKLFLLAVAFKPTTKILFPFFTSTLCLLPSAFLCKP